MNKESDCTWLSLRQAAHRILAGSEPKHEQLQFPRKRKIRRKMPALISAFQALMTGEIATRGLLSRLELDFPEQEPESEGSERFVHRVRRKVRREYDGFVLGRCSEPEFSTVPAYLWSFAGAICERDLLWVHCPPGHESEYEAAYDERLEKLRKRPMKRLVPPPIERPYTPEQLIFFADVQVSAGDLLNWQRAASAPEQPVNERNAGRKGWDQWPAVRAWIRNAIDAGIEWDSQQDLCDDLPWEGVTTDALRKHLDQHDPELRGGVRAACKRKRRN